MNLNYTELEKHFNFRYIFLLFLFSGCTPVVRQEPIVIQNDEKEAYIKKVEQTVGESASALVAVAPSVPAGISRELLQNQIDRLSAISQPNAGSVELFRRILSSNDEQALKAQDTKADKEDSELKRLREKSAAKDKELDAEKLVRAAAEARAEREAKDKILFKLSMLGMGIFALGLGIIAFTPFKRNGAVFVSGGLLAMGSAWIFDSKWFPWVAGATVAIALLEFSLMFFSKQEKKESIT